MAAGKPLFFVLLLLTNGVRAVCAILFTKPSASTEISMNKTNKTISMNKNMPKESLQFCCNFGKQTLLHPTTNCTRGSDNFNCKGTKITQKVLGIPVKSSADEENMMNSLLELCQFASCAGPFNNAKILSLVRRWKRDKTRSKHPRCSHQAMSYYLTEWCQKFEKSNLEAETSCEKAKEHAVVENFERNSAVKMEKEQPFSVVFSRSFEDDDGLEKLSPVDEVKTCEAHFHNNGNKMHANEECLTEDNEYLHEGPDVLSETPQKLAVRNQAETLLCSVISSYFERTYNVIALRPCQDGNEGGSNSRCSQGALQANTHGTGSTGSSSASQEQAFGVVGSGSSFSEGGCGGDGDDPRRHRKDCKIGGCSNSEVSETDRKSDQKRRKDVPEGDKDLRVQSKHKKLLVTENNDATPGTSQQHPCTLLVTQAGRRQTRDQSSTCIQSRLSTRNTCPLNDFRRQLSHIPAISASMTTLPLGDCSEIPEEDVDHRGCFGEAKLNQEVQCFPLSPNPESPPQTPKTSIDPWRTFDETSSAQRLPHQCKKDAPSDPVTNPLNRDDSSIPLQEVPDLSQDHNVQRPSIQRRRSAPPDRQNLTNYLFVPESEDEDYRNIPPRKRARLEVDGPGQSDDPVRRSERSQRNHRNGDGPSASRGAERPGSDGSELDRSGLDEPYQAQEFDIQSTSSERRSRPDELRLNRTFYHPPGPERRTWYCFSCGSQHLMILAPDHVCDNCGRFFCLEHWERHDCIMPWFEDDDDAPNQDDELQQEDDNHGEGGCDSGDQPHSSSN